MKSLEQKHKQVQQDLATYIETSGKRKAHIASEMGVTPGYISHLTNSERKLSSISASRIEAYLKKQKFSTKVVDKVTPIDYNEYDDEVEYGQIGDGVDYDEPIGTTNDTIEPATGELNEIQVSVTKDSHNNIQFTIFDITNNKTIENIYALNNTPLNKLISKMLTQCMLIGLIFWVQFEYDLHHKKINVDTNMGNGGAKWRQRQRQPRP